MASVHTNMCTHAYNHTQTRTHTQNWSDLFVAFIHLFTGHLTLDGKSKLASTDLPTLEREYHQGYNCGDISTIELSSNERRYIFAS